MFLVGFETESEMTLAVLVLSDGSRASGLGIYCARTYCMIMDEYVL